MRVKHHCMKKGVLTNQRRQLADLGGRGRDDGHPHGENHPRARADPEDLLARQQRRDPEAGGLVLPDYLVATFKKRKE